MFCDEPEQQTMCQNQPSLLFTFASNALRSDLGQSEWDSSDFPRSSNAALSVFLLASRGRCFLPLVCKKKMYIVSSEVFHR